MKKKLQRFFTLTRQEAGFTLVELIVVIAILAILAGIAVPAYNGYIDKANEAADQQLLAAINTAFAAACVEEGLNPYDLESASILLNTEKKVNLSSLKPAALIESFTTLFTGNEDSAFAVYTNLAYDETIGGFKASTMSQLYSDLMAAIISGNVPEIELFKDSAFMEIGSEALLGQVSDVSNLASQLIAANSTLTGVVMDDAYIASLASRLGKDADVLKAELETMFAEDPNAFSQYMANSTVLNVAGTMNDATKYNEAETLTMFANANWGGLGTTLNTDPEYGLAQVAALYGLYTAYDSEAASQLALTGDVAALIELKDDTEFNAYLSQVNTEGSDAYKDYQAYKAALSVVNESADNTEVANDILDNGYDNAELLALLQGVMGG